MTNSETAIKLLMDIIPRMLHSFTTSIRGPEVGMSPAHFRILHMLHHQPMSMSEMAQKQFITKASLCDSVNLLVEKGWIMKSRDQADQRRINLTLTTEGEEELNLVKRQLHDRIAQRLINASDEDLDAITNGLFKIEELFLK